MPRNNARLSFAGKTGMFAIGVPVNKIAYRWEVIATESHAKRYRAMYPHQRAIAQFALTFQLNGYRENKLLLDFFSTFNEGAIYGTSQPMHVLVAARDFFRIGFPIKGMVEGDRVGSMVFAPTIVFESITDPMDPTIFNQASEHISRADATGTETDVKNFFYPFSKASYDTAVKPETVYDLDGPQNGSPWAPQIPGGSVGGSGNTNGTGQAR